MSAWYSAPVSLSTSYKLALHTLMRYSHVYDIEGQNTSYRSRIHLKA